MTETAIIDQTSGQAAVSGQPLLHGRFMLPDTSELQCKVTELSIEGATFLTDTPPPPGLPIVAYLDEIGRVVGISGQPVEGGFTVKFTVAGTRRDRLVARLEWLTKKLETGDSGQRQAERHDVANKNSHLSLPDGRVYACEVLDISLSGAAVKTDVMPTLGTQVLLGKMRGRIVRYIDQGIAIEFVKPLDGATLAEELG